MRSSARDQRATAFRERAKRLIARDHAENRVVIPRLGGLRRGFYLRKKHVMNETAVLPNVSVLDVEIVDWHGAHLRHHSFRLIGTGGGDRIDVVAVARKK